MKIVSLFSGCGGLDLGFKKAGFDIIWANEYDSTIWETFENNFPNTHLDKRSILDINSSEIPACDGIIGGPPCQSWSLAGSMRGIDDERGRLFYEYLRILKDKKPKFFLAENVAGIVSSAHLDSFEEIIKKFDDIGYDVNYQLLNTFHYGIPQDRKRVIIIGYHKSLGKSFVFPQPGGKQYTLKDAIKDLPIAKPAKEKNYANNNTQLNFSNHEYMNGGFSTIYMSRNRRRDWDEPSFTIQAGGRHAPLHPDSPKMKKVGEDAWDFVGDKNKVRRLSIRDCARIQTFPDDFIFYYNRVADGYKMIGNAVPAKLANILAKEIKNNLV